MPRIDESMAPLVPSYPGENPAIKPLISVYAALVSVRSPWKGFRASLILTKCVSFRGGPHHSRYRGGHLFPSRFFVDELFSSRGRQPVIFEFAIAVLR